MRGGEEVFVFAKRVADVTIHINICNTNNVIDKVHIKYTYCILYVTD